MNGLYVKPARKPYDHAKRSRWKPPAMPVSTEPPPENFSFFLTPPPSTNALYANRRYGKGRGRIKTAAYKAWIKTAWGEIREQHVGQLPHYPGNFELEIWLPGAGRQDIDNVKAIPDLLKTLHLITDDKRMVSLKVLHNTSDKACITISLPADHPL